LRLSNLLSQKAARGFTLGVALWLLAGAMVALPAQAGGLALSGTFYRQDFHLPQGSSLHSPDVYIVAFNNTGAELGIKMATEEPPGVKLVLSEDDFHLKAGEQKKVEIGIEVSADAIPGEYTLKITAQAYKEAQGIQLLGAAGQDAKLTITGEKASVEITTTSLEGDPIPAVIRLFRESGDQSFDIGYSETGELKATVTPGNYRTSAYVAGKQVAEESFAIAADEAKKISMTVQTVYFEGFGIVPNYEKDSGKLAMAKIVYAVNNLYQAFPEAEVKLNVSYNGQPLEKISLTTFSPLAKGKQELNYNYIPTEGWQEGLYRFRLELYTGGEVYTTSPEKDLTGSGNSGSSLNWILIGGIAGGVVLLVIIILVVRRLTY